MKLIIDISEEDYKWVCEQDMGFELYKMIANGTSLPRGCGRLIDADEYKRMWVDTFDSCYGDACAKLFKDSVDNALTIIEADKGDKE